MSSTRTDSQAELKLFDVSTRQRTQENVESRPEKNSQTKLNLFDVLRRQKINGNKAELKAWLAKNSENNVRQDMFVSHTINLERNYYRLGHSDSYLAILESVDILSLFDIESAKKLWSVAVNNAEDYICLVNGLIVSNSGLVLHVAKRRDFSGRTPPHCQIFLEGKYVGSFTADGESFWSGSFKIVNNRIFGILLSYKDRELYEWDIYGNLVQSITMDVLKAASGSEMAAYEDYFGYLVVAADSKLLSENLPIFIFNLQDNTTKKIELPQSEAKDENDEEVDAVCALRNELIVGTHYNKLEPKNSFKVACEPNIKIIDIQSGKVKSTYTFDNRYGKIRNLISNDQFIIFLNYNSSDDGDYLYCINLDEEEIFKIKLIPKCMEGQLNINLNNNLLTICYPTGSWKIGEAWTHRCVIDLNTNEMLQEMRYRRSPLEMPFFSSNTFIVPTRCTSEASIYIEKFTTIIDAENDEKPTNAFRKPK